MLAILAAATLGVTALPFTVNFSPSMPTGIYRTAPAAGALVRDDVIVVCPPVAAAEFARLRGYLGPGPCAPGTASLLKFVAAVSGDVVTASPAGIRVNGRPLRNSAAFATDVRGRPLPHVPPRSYRLASGRLWLYAPFPRSWDSRYFGPVRERDVRARAFLVLPIGDGAYVSRYGWGT